MVTEIYKEDVKKFMNLADSRIWKKAIISEANILGSIMDTEDGFIPAGVMIYYIKKDVSSVKMPFIHVKWVYASTGVSEKEKVYKDLFDELEAVAKRQKIKLISISIPLLEEYNCEGLAIYINSRGYDLVVGSSDNIDAVLKLD